MTEETNMVLEHLKKFQGTLERVIGSLDEVKGRLASLEVGQAGILTFIAHHDTALARQQVFQDRLTARVERIERRLDLVDTPQGTP
jgi:hypothetical protein